MYVHTVKKMLKKRNESIREHRRLLTWKFFISRQKFVEYNILLSYEGS